MQGICPSCHQPYTPNNPTIFTDGHMLFYDGKNVRLSGQLTLLAKLLAQNFGLTVSRDRIWETVWGNSQSADKNIMNVRIWKLRKLIAPIGLKIERDYGVGYRMEAA